MIPYVPPPNDDGSQKITPNPPPPRPAREEGIQEGANADWPDIAKVADDLVTVATFRFVHEAELAKLHLGTESIQSFIMDAETVTMDWLLGNAIGNIKLQVAAADADRAEAILERFRPDPNAPPIPETGDFACLSCGSVIPPDENKCPACGWSYTDEGIQAER
jgi:hypothetical protein